MPSNNDIVNHPRFQRILREAAEYRVLRQILTEHVQGPGGPLFDAPVEERLERQGAGVSWSQALSR